MQFRLIALCTSCLFVLSTSPMVRAGTTPPSDRSSSETHPFACKHVEGSLEGPFVPNAATARQIFNAVRTVVAPDFASAKNSSITIRDTGPYWVVSQNIRVIGQDGKLLELMGGAGFSVYVDKCSGAILKAAFNR